MSDVENKTENKPERSKGVRGELGQATAALTIKRRYHHAHFTRVNADDKRNLDKMVWVRNDDSPSLKQFARKLIASGDANAKAWFANKAGAQNAKRSDANIAAARATSAATKMERHKKSAGNAKK